MQKMKLEVESLVVSTFAAEAPQVEAFGSDVSVGITDCSCRPYFCLPSESWVGIC